MSRLWLAFSVAGAAWLIGCAGDSDINQPSGRTLPANGISIVEGAQNRGTAAFTPNPLTISLANDPSVVWFNDDQMSGGYGGGNGVSHNITADDGSFESGIFQPGSTYLTTFSAAGDYGYHCSIHPGMRGRVVVTP
jgi:plastocyanin